MLETVLKLFRYSPLFQTVIGYVCFGIVSTLVVSLQVYSHGLSSSFAETVPHIVVDLTDQGAERSGRLAEILSATGGVKVVSPYCRATDTFPVESVEIYSSGKNTQTSYLEVIGTDLSQFPFVIPFENVKGLQKQNYANGYTSKELAFQLMENEKAVVVNNAMNSLFSTPNREIEDEYLLFPTSRDMPPVEIKIVGMMKDLQDSPKIFAHLDVACRLAGRKGFDGYFIRLDLENRPADFLETVQSEIEKRLKDLGLRGYRISNWKEGENRQQKIFAVFRFVVMTVIVSVFLLSLFSGVLGLFRTFVVKQRSITILLRLGTSKRFLFAVLAVINGLALSTGLLAALATVFILEDSLVELFLAGLRQVVHIGRLHVDWLEVLAVVSAIFACYLAIFTAMLIHIVENKQPVKI